MSLPASNPASTLDAPDRFGGVDPSDTLGVVEGSAEQWARARHLSLVRMDLDGADAVVVAGMGGSGICGDLAAALAVDRLQVPVVPHKGYGLPAFAGPRTVVVAVSHSGETEETLDSVEAALARDARVVAVTAGGTLGRRCSDAGVPWVRTPGGGQPRHALGWLAGAVLAALGLDDGMNEAIAVLRAQAAACGRHVPTAANPAKQVALRVAADGTATIWGCGGLTVPAAYRLKCQLNENAKLPSICAQLPELDHNEPVVRGPGGPGAGVVWLRDPAGEDPRVRARVDGTRAVVNGRFDWWVEQPSDGRGPLARVASLLLFGDLVSVYAAIALGRDPTPIPEIVRLKRRLASAPAGGGGP